MTTEPWKSRDELIREAAEEDARKEDRAYERAQFAGKCALEDEIAATYRREYRDFLDRIAALFANVPPTLHLSGEAVAKILRSAARKDDPQ